MKKLLTLIILLFCSNLFAQNLNPGDLQFIGIQTRTSDKFAFVVLDSIPSGTVIKFTDRGWDVTNAFRSSEDTMVWTAPTLTKGTVVIIDCITNPATDNVGGTSIGSLSGLSQSGENLFAFQGTVANPVFIAGLATQPFILSGNATSNTTYLPNGLTLGSSAFAFPRLKSNGFYNIDTTNGSVSAVQSMINDSLNWLIDDSNNVAGSLVWPNWVFFNNTSSGGGFNFINFANANLAFGEASGNNSVFLTFTASTTQADTVRMRLIQVAGTSVFGTDYFTTPAAVNDTMILVIPSGSSNASFTFTPINNAVVNAARSIRFRMISVTSGLVLGTQNETLISITDDDSAVVPTTLPTYSIGTINTSNATTGITDSLNVNCKIVGIVNSVNYSTNGLQFAIYDATGAITAYKSTNVSPPYTVTEGDELRVIGKVSQFNGLTQITIDSMVILTRGNTVNPPITVTTLVEVQESKLIQLNGYRLVNASQWPALNSSANVTISNGVDTVTLRIDSDTNIDGTPAPNTLFSVIGIQTQFDNSAPYTSGYQILPRRITDIIPLTNPQLNFSQSTGTIAENGGTYNLPISLNSSMMSNEMVKIAISNVSGGAVYGTHYTTTPAASADTITLNLTKNTNTVAIPVSIIDNTTFNPNRVIRFEMVNNTLGITLGINPSFILNITENDPNSCQCLGDPISNIYPNPSYEFFILPYEGLQLVEIYAINGKKVISQMIQGKQTFNHGLETGIYLAKWTEKGNSFQQRLIVR
jgi:DNA/RNA endonuclease YhcR with UshA esterase domain